ncbi:hypothetical protein [Roseateles sp.]|uniref:hypothetical protein n=1 Tax=Roseateles sp. TaxID=1971397 RepID=UPI0025CFB925|nr:hypothetical protein [Roseateles sp.]MBV8034657.1 hypothetical protein [Roseateles sp.]
MHFALLTWPNTGSFPEYFPDVAASPARRRTPAALAERLRRLRGGIDPRLAIAALASLAGLLLPTDGWAAGCQAGAMCCFAFIGG